MEAPATGRRLLDPQVSEQDLQSIGPLGRERPKEGTAFSLSSSGLFDLVAIRSSSFRGEIAERDIGKMESGIIKFVKDGVGTKRNRKRARKTKTKKRRGKKRSTNDPA